MDSPATVAEIVPATATEAALAEAAERIVAAVASPEVTRQFTLFDLLRLYDLGCARIHAADAERWRIVFALAGSTDGVWETRAAGKTTALAVFWRTKNPHVRLEREIPEPVPEGNYAYIGWAWNFGSPPMARSCMDHIMRRHPGVEFIACHDQRARWRKNRRGRLWVYKVPAGRFALANALFVRNGNGRIGGY